MYKTYPDNAGIYKLTFKINNKIYIGKSVNLRKRMKEYSNYENLRKGRYYIQNAIIKHGWDSFTVEVLEIFENFNKLRDNSKLLDRESFYIESYNSTNRDIGYNICKFSNDRTGILCSEESKERMRKPKSKEARENMSRSSLGKPKTKEHIEKLRQSKLGKPNLGRVGKKHSLEAREKMRQSKLGKSLSEHHKDRIRQSKSKINIIDDKTPEI